MGKGDKRSRKGKLFMGSRGKTRPSRTSKTAAPVVKAKAAEVAEVAEAVAEAPKKKAAKKKAPAA